MDIFHRLWPDLLIVAAMAYFLRTALRRGFVVSILEFVGYAAAVAAATVLYLPLAGWLSGALHISRGLAKSMTFVAVWWIAGSAIAPLIRLGIVHLPLSLAQSRWNRLFGLPAGVLEFAVTVPFLLAVAISMPLPTVVIADLSAAGFTGWLLRRADDAERLAAAVYGDAFQETLSFVTVQSRAETEDLGFRTGAFVLEPGQERRLFAMVNDTRLRAGLKPFLWDDKLADLARLHSADMLVRGFFSHTTPDGKTAMQRAASMDGLRFRAIGENLAFAKDLSAAHSGLLASPGHRANILSSVFSRIGIGIESVPGRGLMISQEFAD